MKKVRFVVLNVILLLAMAIPVFAAPAPKIDICHRTDIGDYQLINVSQNAKDAHIKHGDFVANTGGLDESCVPPPVVEDQAIFVAENSPNGTVVGTIIFSGDGPTLAVIGGTGDTAFSVDSNSGEITVIDSPQLDFESTPSFTLDVLVSNPSGGTDTATITINLTDVEECIDTEAMLRAAAAAGGSFCVTSAAPIVLTGGEVIIGTNLALTSDGSGNATIDGNQGSRVFKISGIFNTLLVTLNLTDITVTGGSASSGGGVLINFGSLILNGNSAVDNNTASHGGGVFNQQGSLTMNDQSRISNNTSQGLPGLGGGLTNNGSTTVMNDSASISNNTASWRGGGVYTVNGASLILNGSAVISQNTAGEGGGIYAYPGTINGVTSSNVSSNTPNNCAGEPVPGCSG